jgi:uncharacterized protein YecE (DUF72 family)
MPCTRRRAVPALLGATVPSEPAPSLTLSRRTGRGDRTALSGLYFGDSGLPDERPSRVVRTGETPVTRLRRPTGKDALAPVASEGNQTAAEKPILTPAERRARREARRAKQREANVGRAAKMHAARMAAGSALPSSPKPLAAPEQDPAEDETGEPKSAQPQQIHVGCSGWFYWHWRGGFYPSTTPTSKWFDHYASRFKTVELNAPFYAWPTVATVETWRRQAGRRRFVYTVKVSELITHVKRFAGTKGLVKDFGYIADLLGPRMGCFLFQLPPSFHYTPPRLKGILGQLDPGRRNVVEFRHRSWWTERVFAAFRETGTIFCSCSGPRLPDELVKTADDVYVRFHGTKQWYRHDYSKEELATWASRIRDSGAARVWAYFNNDREGYAIKNAKELLRQLKRGGGGV